MSRVSASKTPNSIVYRKNNGGSGFSSSNPFDFDSDTEQNARSTRASSAPTINQSIRRGPKYNYSGYENQSVQQLENYVVHQAEETTQKINTSLMVAEEIREVSSKILVNLHQQVSR